jgi:hypothetical protein
MATTTNYSWTTPDDTALVKDGAAAIRTLGSSIDTTTKNLNPSTTLGDIEYRSSTANTNTRLGIGTTGQVLSVVGGVPAWGNISAGGMTLLSTTTLSGGTTTISGIASGYNYLYLVMTGFDTTTGFAGHASVRPNATTNAFYGVYFGNENGSYGSNVYNGDDLKWTSQTGSWNGAMTDFCAVMKIDNYTSTTNFKPVEQICYFDNGGPDYHISQQGAWRTNSAITSLDFVNAGSWAAGTVLIYGVK